MRSASNVVLDFSSVIQEAENITYMPGAIQKFKVHIKINQKTINIKMAALHWSTADTDDFALYEGALLPFLGYDGHYIPITPGWPLCSPIFLSRSFWESVFSSVNFEEMCQIFDKLEEKGYEGETRWIVICGGLNKKLKTDCGSMEELYLENKRGIFDII